MACGTCRSKHPVICRLIVAGLLAAAATALAHLARLKGCCANKCCPSNVTGPCGPVLVPDAEPEVTPESAVEPETEAAPAPAPEPETAPAPAPEPETAPAPAPEPETAPAPAPEPETAPGPAPEPEAVPETEPVEAPEPTAEPAPTDEELTVGYSNPFRYGEGSFIGIDPPEGFDIKANERSMKYHIPGAIGYVRCNTDVWFNSAEAAERAGFTRSQR